MISRPTRHEVFLLMARELSRLSTCLSRKVGCIITDTHDRVIAEGYNGIPSGVKHICAEQTVCQRKSKAGQNLEMCNAIHAEANALIYCNDIKSIKDIYLWGASPCFECAKLICNTSASHVFTNVLYTPEHVERVLSLFKMKAITLWLVDFKDGVLVDNSKRLMNNIKEVC